MTDLLSSSLNLCPSVFEVVAVENFLGQFLFCDPVCSVYMFLPIAHVSYMELLCSFLVQADNTYVVVVGDFNLMPDVNWDTLQGSCPGAHIFCESVLECNLTQLISEPTHCKGNVLDLVLTKDLDIVDAVRVHSTSDCPLPLTIS